MKQKYFPRLNTYRGKFHAPLFFVLLGLFGAIIMAVMAAVWGVIKLLAWMQE